MKQQLNEGLDYHDMKGQIEPVITVDEYKAKMGKDSDIVTVTFTVNSKMAAQDLVTWLEIGYDFVLDASVSDGEIEPGKYLVFVEMNRRTSVPQRIVTMLEDLETLTDLPVKDYSVEIKDETYDADVDTLKQIILLSPHEYREANEKDEELNEYRNLAGLDHKTVFEQDTEIKNFINLSAKN